MPSRLIRHATKPPLNIPPTCGKAGCEAAAEWQPILVLHAPRRYRGPGYEGAPAELSIGFCAEHRRGLTAKDLLSDAGWLQISRAFEEIGRVRPRRRDTQLRWARIPSAP